MSFLPITPVQAAVLGRRPAPVATINATGAATLPPAPTGQSAVPVATPAVAALGFQPNSMDEFLLGRANRPGEIGGGVELLGRLAALGVGRKIRRENEQGQRDAVEAAIGSLPPEMQAAARIAALSGDPSKILPMLQQQASIAAQTAENAKDREAQAALQTQRLESSAEQAALERAQQAAQFAEKMGIAQSELDLDRAALANTMATDAARLAIQQEELQLKKDIAAAEAAADDLDLNESERKSLGFLAQMSEPAGVLNSEEFAGYVPSPLTEQMLKQIAAFGDTSAAGFLKSYISGEFYQQMDDTEKRYFTNALGFAEAATRKASGATVTGADLAITFGRLINRAGDTPEILADKARARDVEIESLLVTLPQKAIDKLL